jgi:type II secretion system protein I
MAGRKGFMLLELIVSLAILSAGLLSVARSFIPSLRAGNSSRQYTLACTLAEEKLSELEQSADLSEGEMQGGFEETYSEFSWKSEVKASSNENLNHVMVTILWEEKGREKEVKLATLLLK